MSATNNELLTGNELEIETKSYSIKDKNDNDFFLGKLLRREKFTCPFNGVPLDHNVFIFEHNPSSDIVSTVVYPTTKMFSEVKTGGSGSRKTKMRRQQKTYNRRNRKTSRRTKKSSRR
jgi:hypothetical protein